MPFRGKIPKLAKGLLLILHRGFFDNLIRFWGVARDLMTKKMVTPSRGEGRPERAWPSCAWGVDICALSRSHKKIEGNSRVYVPQNSVHTKRKKVLQDEAKPLCNADSPKKHIT